MTDRLTPMQHNDIKNLVVVRHAARNIILGKRRCERLVDSLQESIESAISAHDKETERSLAAQMVNAKELLLQGRFHTIEIGKYLAAISGRFNDIPREHWLRALCVNESEWDSENMNKHGYSLLNVVSVLDLENSSTQDDDIALKPLKWCCTMAMLNATKTNPSLGKVMHDACNEVLGGVFGEWREPSVLERLGVAT